MAVPISSSGSKMFPVTTMKKNLLPTLALTALALPLVAPLPAQAQQVPAITESATATATTAATLTPVPSHRKLRLAVYKGAGAGEDSRKTLMTALARDPNIVVEDITAEEIRAGKLDGYDVVVQPGGSGGGQGKALGEEGRTKIQEFVKKGGGYLGVCGGAYLATTDYPWSLHILNARVIDKAHWARGHGPVAVAPTVKGEERMVSGNKPIDIIYWQGPLLAPGADTALPAYEEWATFKGEIADKGAPKGVMPGTTAVAATTYGAGRVVCFSPHPEKTVGQEPLLHHAVLWAVANAPVSVTPAADEKPAEKASEKKPEKSASAAAFQEQVTAHFSAWDRDKNGTLSIAEIDEAVSDSAITGPEAAAIATLKRASRSLPTADAPLNSEALQAMAGAAPEKSKPNLPELYTWALKRLPEKRDALFSAGTPKLETLHQGKLGDCFCLAPMGGLLARNPQDVAKLFERQTDGTYQVKLGAKTIAVAAPTDAEIILSASTERSGMWLNLYEKAIGTDRIRAKGNTGSALDAVSKGGSAGTMLSMLTGHKIMRFSCTFAKKPETTSQEREAKLKDLRAGLVSAVKDRRLITCGTTKPKTPGITPNHAYAILGYDAQTDTIRLWNPHGDNFKPKGPEGLQNGYLKSKGIFSMPLVDFVDQFAGVAFETTEAVEEGKSSEIPFVLPAQS
jgi:hypothetical protein